MPQQQGEISLLTLFADIHYFYGPPTAKPPHHSFDKSSYVYLYHNPIAQRGRLEIANNAGTPDQTAFSGATDSIRIEQSYKHPTLFTITVDAFRSRGSSANSSPQQDMSQWHLPAPDPRNDGKYMYRLHTVDIYFWTADDATIFLDSLKRVLQSHQLQILEAPTPIRSAHQEYRDTMSPVVEKLEQAAISKNFPARSASISTTQSFNGPPTVPTPHRTVTPPQQQEAPASFAPMAYNPAAPAAPEPIAHREKTPPPPDVEDGTGLTTAAIKDHQAQLGAPPYQQNSFAPQSTNQPYIPGPPQRQPTQPFPGPPAPGIQRANTSASFPPPPPQSSSTGPPQGQGYAHSFAPPPQEAAAPYDGGPPQPGIQRQATMPALSQEQYANYSSSPGFPTVQSPGHPPTPGYPAVQSPGFPPQQGGYQQMSYGQTTDQYAVHNPMHSQLYRPTESEAKHGKQPPVVGPGPGVQPGNFERRADKIEKGVGRFLKKLDKRV